MKPLTIITTVLNGKAHIESMLASAPADPRIEHLVIDAGSSDGTLDVLRAQPHLNLIVRPSLSLYSAWNEAVAAAQGRYVIFLNADDELPPGALDIMLSWLDASNGSDLLCGEAEAFSLDNSDQTRRVVYRYRGEALTGRALAALIFGACNINAKVFPRQLILDAGGFDTSFALAADRDLLLRIALLHPNVAWRCVAAPFYRYRIHAGSKTLQPAAARRIQIAQEHRRIAERLITPAATACETGVMLSAWMAHETAVTVLRGLEIGALRTAAAALMDLIGDAPNSLTKLSAAHRWRYAYASRLRAADTESARGMESGHP